VREHRLRVEIAGFLGFVHHIAFQFRKPVAEIVNFHHQNAPEFIK
jgi:hypothetical protein